MKKNKVIIVMPAYFAEKTLGKTYLDLPLNLRKNVLLVDDASKDGTVELAKKLGLKVVVHKKNLGYGGNQKTCYSQALKMGADIVVMVHPDYQYDSSMANELIRPIRDGWLDIMMGNRVRSRTEVLTGGMPLYKYFSNRLLTIIENLVLGLNLGEFHSGYRAYSAKVLKAIPFDKFSDDFIFDQQFLISAKDLGFKMGEIPVPVRYFPEASSINMKRSIKYGIQTLYYLLLYILKRLDIFHSKIFRK